ncbi:hypothetical protein NPIL_532741 [Nephila pilipes]|uniref:Uncharacterized protein n=1 Tax=Nephila pilipes TaxID=299642 RepID=A0A8X6ISY3_NEPPI|nr:hypothetical protein NPIL_532741 [Nephila pilipes]
MARWPGFCLQALFHKDTSVEECWMHIHDWGSEAHRVAGQRYQPLMCINIFHTVVSLWRGAQTSSEGLDLSSARILGWPKGTLAPVTEATLPMQLSPCRISRQMRCL